MTGPRAMSVGNVAIRWDCSRGKVRSLIKTGEMPVFRLG
jgi:hypothetical protein